MSRVKSYKYNLNGVYTVEEVRGTLHGKYNKFETLTENFRLGPIFDVDQNTSIHGIFYKFTRNPDPSSNLGEQVVYVPKYDISNVEGFYPENKSSGSGSGSGSGKNSLFKKILGRGRGGARKTRKSQRRNLTRKRRSQ